MFFANHVGEQAQRSDLLANDPRAHHGGTGTTTMLITLAGTTVPRNLILLRTAATDTNDGELWFDQPRRSYPK